MLSLSDIEYYKQPSKTPLNRWYHYYHYCADEEYSDEVYGNEEYSDISEDIAFSSENDPFETLSHTSIFENL